MKMWAIVAILFGGLSALPSIGSITSSSSSSSAPTPWSSSSSSPGSSSSTPAPGSFSRAEALNKLPMLKPERVMKIISHLLTLESAFHVAWSALSAARHFKFFSRALEMVGLHLHLGDTIQSFTWFPEHDRNIYSIWYQEIYVRKESAMAVAVSAARKAVWLALKRKALPEVAVRTSWAVVMYHWPQIQQEMEEALARNMFDVDVGKLREFLLFLWLDNFNTRTLALSEIQTLIQLHLYELLNEADMLEYQEVRYNIPRLLNAHGRNFLQEHQFHFEHARAQAMSAVLIVIMPAPVVALVVTYSVPANSTEIFQRLLLENENEEAREPVASTTLASAYHYLTNAVGHLSASCMR